MKLEKKMNNTRQSSTRKINNHNKINKKKIKHQY